jgi:hypothetical protein
MQIVQKLETRWSYAFQIRNSELELLKESCTLSLLAISFRSANSHYLKDLPKNQFTSLDFLYSGALSNNLPLTCQLFQHFRKIFLSYYLKVCVVSSWHFVQIDLFLVTINNPVNIVSPEFLSVFQKFPL